ncbi:MAG: SBBP repeat-containing protein [Betaproteobacteria bacterium]|nr:SBBP repeat-containing protein [Betaproteobacteria bacterium]
MIKIGTRDAFVIKLDAIGVAAWAREYGGLNPGGYAAIDATALDATGQTYVAGTFNGATITLGSVTLTRIGDYDVLVAKLDMDGNVIWARNFGGVGAYAYGQSVAVDGAGNVFLGGVFEDASLTTPALARIGRGDAFVIKLDATGATVWAKNFGGSGASVYAQSVATDGVGNVYLGGYFGSANLTAPALTKIGYADTFVVKLDMTGATTWARNFGGIGASTFGQSFAPDSAGSIYLSGAFGGADLTTPALTRIGSQDAFVVKLDATGTATWAQNFGGNGASAAFHGLAVDGDGNAYVGGWFGNADLTTPALVRIGSYDAFAVKVDAAGTIAWARTFGGSGATAVARSIALDGAGSVYLGGYFDNASLATPAMARIGAQDAFAIKLNGGGTTTWSRNFGGSGATAAGESITADGAGNVYLGGTFHAGSLTAPPLSLIGTWDGFIIKVSTLVVPTIAAIAPANGPTAGGTSITISGTTLTDASSVTIGGVAATGITVLDDTTITATTPAGMAGARIVVVTTPGGTSTDAVLFTYIQMSSSMPMATAPAMR